MLRKRPPETGRTTPSNPMLEAHGQAAARPMDQINQQLQNRSNSFDSLEVVADGHMACVKKTFVRDLSRASDNVSKQRRFQSFSAAGFKVSAAEVLQFNQQADKAELLMPYVEGLSGETLVIHGSRKIAQALSEAFSALLLHELAKSDVQAVAVAVFREKLESCLVGCEHPAILAHADRMRRYLVECGDEIQVPIGPCHGDLTLSNVIFNPVDGVVLIDFLQTFLESPLQDLAKIRQDYEFGWSCRKSNPSIKLKAAIFCSSQPPSALKLMESMFPAASLVFTALVLFRIVPYAKDEDTMNWIDKSLTTLFKRSFA